MEETIINSYYNIYSTGEVYFSTQYDTTYIYIPPDDINYLDFSLLVDFTTRCILIKKGILQEDKNIDISKIPQRKKKKLFKFIDYIIDVYKTCSKRSYIDIDKAIIFWNIYCIMKTTKTISIVNCESKWNFNGFPNYLLSSIYENNKVFPTTINNIEYSIYNDWSFCPGSYHIISKCVHYIPSCNIVGDDLRILLIHIKRFPIYLCIQILCIIYTEYENLNNTQYENLWFGALHICINNIKYKIYYPKYHPLSIMTNRSLSNEYKCTIFKKYFNLTPKYIQL